MKKILSPELFRPFREGLFRTLWMAAFISNVGTWMQNVGVSWLAATLSASPLMISLIQTASSLPALLFSYPAGVISDHSDRRKLLIGLQLFLFAVVLVLFLFAQWQLLNIRLLIFFTFLIGIGSALTTPVWQAITPEVVSKDQLNAAIALNGVNFNLARAVGPALGGIILVLAGIKSIFLFNALSFLALVIGLWRWRNSPSPVVALEFGKTAWDGLKAVRRSRPFLRVLIRTVSFTAFVSIIFAFLPQLSKYVWKQNSAEYTWLWVSLGIGALLGSYFYGTVTRAFNATKIMFLSCELIAVCLALITLTGNFYWLNIIMVITGIGWITATSTLNVLAQQQAPAELRGRFLAVNVTVFQGSLALSSLGWGYLSNMLTTLSVVKVAAIGMGLFSAVLAFFPMEDVAKSPNKTLACADPLLQPQLK